MSTSKPNQASNQTLSLPLFDVLIVDDDYELLELLEDFLQRAGYSFRSAASIREARNVIEQNCFRCLLVDQNLPDGLGVQFIAGLKSEATSSISILMTGSVDRDTIINAVNEGGIFKVFIKPFTLLEFGKSLEAAITQFGAEQGRRIYAREVEAQNEMLSSMSSKAHSDGRDASLNQQGQDVESDQESRRQVEWVSTKVQMAYLQTVASLTRAIEAKDYYTHGHSERVYYYCSLIAEILELPESSRNDLRFASVLHDIGKIGIPDSILLKSGRLTDAEREIIAEHPILSESIISPLPFLDKVRRIVRQHHEHYDGTGYPDGLKGNDIAIEARILSIADAYDAMRSDRPYRKALSTEIARTQLELGEGTQFCPLCVRSFLHALTLKSDFRSDGAGDANSIWSNGAFVELEPHVNSQPNLQS
jgi:response regulator RpfG family c-di-GMP phosphodiesterase